MRKTLLRVLGRAVFKLRGWSFEPLPDYWQQKQVVIGLPHTALSDTLMAFAGFAIVEQKGHIIIKREAFRWPLGPFLRSLGAIPVDRDASSGVVGQMAKEFAARKEFQLAIVPAGTRREGARLRTGFWHIAKAAQVPVVCWFLDAKQKRTRWVGRIVPGDDLAADLQAIKKMYADAGLVLGGID